MKIITIISGILLFFTMRVIAASLPNTIFQPVYHSLLTGQSNKAWDELISVWSFVTGDLQTIAWQKALNAIVAQQCGKNLTLTYPERIDKMELRLIQKDRPLSRSYQVELAGRTKLKDIEVSLVAPDGRNVFHNSNVVVYKSDGSFSISGPDATLSLGPGVYYLRISSSAGQINIHQSLALQGVVDLDWVYSVDGRLNISPPPTYCYCPKPWLVQSLIQLPSHKVLWQSRRREFVIGEWPDLLGGPSILAVVSVYRSVARGALVVTVEHRWINSFSKDGLK